MVRRGESFRAAHRLVGELVKRAEARGVGLAALTREDWESVSDRFDAEVAQVFDFERSIQQREIVGGTGAQAVRRQIEAARSVI